MLPKTCSIPECERKHYARTWCKTHYQRWAKYGDPLGVPDKRDPAACAFKECTDPAVCRGWCQKHYARFKKHGDPAVAGRIVGDDVTRFWSKVKKTEYCWEWTTGKDKDGYGQFSVENMPRKAHRFSYELKNGPIPAGMQIDHRCHNHACVKPDHLRLATNKQNAENRRGPQRNSLSGVRGVYWSKIESKWFASVKHRGVAFSAGYHATISEAESAVIAKRNELFTHNLLDRLPA